MKRFFIVLGAIFCAVAPLVVQASPVFVIPSADVAADNGASKLDGDSFYRLDRARASDGPAFDVIDSIRISALGSVSESMLSFTPSVDQAIAGTLLRKDSIAQVSTRGISKDWSLSEFTDSQLPPISAISLRDARVFVTFSAWVQQGNLSIPPWAVAEIANDQLILHLDLTDFGIPESARINAMSAFPGESFYFVFASDSQVESRLFSARNAYRLDIDDGLWFEDSSMCLVQFGCIGQSISAMEYTENTMEVFSSDFEEYEK